MKYKKYEPLNFNSIYKAKGYPKKTWPILNEYFSRYKHEFNLSNSEIQSKLSILLNNLDSISISKKGNNEYLGKYYTEEKHIEINTDYIDSLGMGYESILNTIFHELNHVLENRNSESSTSFQEHNSLNFYEGLALNEIITETKASRLAKNDRTKLLKKRNKDKLFLNLDGYSDLIFIGTMLHTTLGISEIDFLKYTDMGKSTFNNLMISKFPTKDDYEQFINNITFYSDTLHSIKYNGVSNEQYTEEDLYNMEFCISHIYNTCLYSMEKVMSHHISENKDNIDIKEYMTKCRFNLEKLNINYKHGMSQILEKSNIDLSQNPYLINLQERIVAIETIDNSKDKLTSYQHDELLSTITNIDLSGKQHLINLYENYGLTPDEDTSSFDKTTDLNYKTKILKEDYGELAWNNNKFNKHIKNFLKMGTMLYKIIDRLKGMTKTKKQDLLPTPSPSYSLSQDSQPNTMDELKLLINDSDYYESETIKTDKQIEELEIDNVK